MNWNWKIFKKIFLSLLWLGTLSGIITSFVIVNKVDEKSTPPINKKSLNNNGFGHKLTDISIEQIKVLANTFSSQSILPSQVIPLTKATVSKWRINIPGVTFALKNKIDGSSSWTFDDTKGSISYIIVASKGKESRTFNMVFSPGSYLSTIQLNIKNWFKEGKNGKKARYPSQRINLEKILFGDNKALFENLKPNEVAKPDSVTMIANFKRINFVESLKKNLVELEIVKWDKSVWELRGEIYGKLTIQIKLTYNSSNIIYGDFELPFLVDPNLSKIQLDIKNWFKEGKNGKKARYPNQRINLEKILFGNNKALFENLKPNEVTKPNSATMIANFKRIVFVEGLNKNLVELEIVKWDKGTRKSRSGKTTYGKLVIRIKITYNSSDIINGDFELRDLRNPSAP